MPFGDGCQNSIEKYRYESKSIGGCLVSFKIKRKAYFHNKWVFYKMRRINGKDWKKKVEEVCK